jgi:hypothetical protein
VLGLLEQQQGWLAALSENKEAKQHLEQEQLGAATFEGNCSSPVLSEAAQRGVSGAGLSDVGRAKDLQLLGGPSVPPVAAAGAAAAGLQDPERQQQQQPDTSGSLSYVAGLLVNATPAQLRRVMDMTAEDWQQYKHDHFMRLVALLELVNRPSCSHDTEDDMPDEQQQQQQQGSLSQKPVARSQPASGSSGASGNTTAMPAGEQDLLPPAAAAAAATSAGAPGSGLELFDIPRRFQDVVDEGITLSFLALFFNHLSIIHASTNADLPQQAAPQSLWLRVVRKLNLTSQQLLQLRLASEEFTRLNRSCSQEAETLMGRANRPSLLLAAEASIQAAASASATAGSGSSASVSRASSSAGVPVSGSGADSSSKGTSAGAAVAPAAAAAAADEDAAAESEAATDDEEHEELDDLLQRHLRLRFLYMVMIGMFVFNTLTRVQIAQMTVRWENGATGCCWLVTKICMWGCFVCKGGSEGVESACSEIGFDYAYSRSIMA